MLDLRPARITHSDAMALKRRFSPWDQLQDKVNSGISWITKESDSNTDFYPRPEKRRYFEGGEVYLSMSLKDGSLFGGCMQEECSNRSVLIENFCPMEQHERDHFNAALKMHEIAIEADDLDVARENRGFLERLRTEKCFYCRNLTPQVLDANTNGKRNESDANTHSVVSSESSSSTTEPSQDPQAHRSEEPTTAIQSPSSS